MERPMVFTSRGVTQNVVLVGFHSLKLPFFGDKSKWILLAFSIILMDSITRKA